MELGGWLRGSASKDSVTFPENGNGESATLSKTPFEMIDESHMSTGLSQIDPASLNWVEHWYPIAWKGLLVAGLITVIGAIGSMGFLLLQWRTSGIREQQSDWRISILEVQAKRANADLERAKSDVADADARAAATQVDATRATERASALEADAAKAQQRIGALEKEAAAAKAATAAANARTAEAQVALEHAKSDIADAEARAVGARVDATRATERASALEADAAKVQERIGALEKEAAAAKAATAAANARAAEAQLALERAKSDIAAADARATGAQADATLATERAAALEADAAKAQEHITTLEKEAAAAAAAIADANGRAGEAQSAPEKFREPRIPTLEHQARIAAAIVPYAGQEYTLSVAAGSEPEALLCAIDAALMAAQWKRSPSSDSITVDTKCGTVGVNTLPGVSVRLSDKAETEQQWRVLVLVNALKAAGIVVDAAIDAENTSPTAIAVMVGAKPE
jgi:colicin import membrane protein